MAVQPRYTRQMAAVAKQAKRDGLGTPKRLSVLQESRQAHGIDNDLEMVKSQRHIRFSAPARIEAARLAAEWLTDWLKVEQPSWSTYHDSVGGVISVRS